MTVKGEDCLEWAGTTNVDPPGGGASLLTCILNDLMNSKEAI